MTTQSFNRINGTPIRVCDERTDEMIILDNHPVYGLDYYVIFTAKYKHNGSWITEYISSEMECVSSAEFETRQKDAMLFEGVHQDYNPATGKFDIIRLNRGCFNKTPSQ